MLAQFWSQARRKLIDATPRAGSPVAEEALASIAALYRIETPETRRAVRQARSKPLVDELDSWLRAQAERLSGRSSMGEAVRYILKAWEPLCVFLDDGRVEMDSNRVENLIRPHALTRKNALFAGDDEGARSWTCLASLIGTCRMNGVEPYAYVKTHPRQREKPHDHAPPSASALAALTRRHSAYAAPTTVSVPMTTPKIVPACTCRSAHSSSVTSCGRFSARTSPPLATATPVPRTTPDLLRGSTSGGNGTVSGQR